MKHFRHRDRIPREPQWPNSLNIPFVIDRGAIRAKCPKCGRITSIRTCYGCKELMCEDCLKEHQIVCLRRGGKQ